ncbi:hypothetical protein FACS1894113_4210 [Alphaproteobacteria bacterium]|nr:hypothetical protein FACS1894113_4210 [Alphaproteobacteria bacterium]
MDLVVQHKKLIKQILGKDIVKTNEFFGNFYVYIRPQNILRTISVLKSNSELAFASLVDCFAAPNEKNNKFFTIYYQLLSFKLNTRVFVATDLPNGDNIQSLTILFENANWFEREIFDMHKISFKDHPNMREIFCCEILFKI